MWSTQGITEPAICPSGMPLYTSSMTRKAPTNRPPRYPKRLILVVKSSSWLPRVWSRRIAVPTMPVVITWPTAVRMVIAWAIT